MASNFIPELWSAELIEKMKSQISMATGLRTPKRDKYSQMLRDKALGRPEFPEIPPPEMRTIYDRMTATEVRIRNEQYRHAVNAAAYSLSTAIDSDILDSLKSRG